MIYATGDAHGSLQRFGSKCFPEQKAMSRETENIMPQTFILP